MGWFRNKVQRWATDTQRDEVERFVNQLRGLDGPDLGLVVAIATHGRHQLEADGHRPMDPVLYVAANPKFPLLLSRQVSDFQKKQQLQLAAATMVWTHTARAAVNLELRTLAREMWRELSRGFPYVDQAAGDFRALTGAAIVTTGACEFPIGFTPDPL